MPVLTAVMKAHANLVIDLRLSNRVTDMVEEGVDVGVRIARSLDARYVARPLARARMAILGSPDYLRCHGSPRRPEDLGAHRHLIFIEPKPMEELVLSREGRVVRVRLEAVMMSNSGEAVMAAARHGVGLAVAPSFLAGRDIQAGSLRQVLPAWSMPDYRVFAVYPHRRLVAPKVRVLVEALTSAFGDGGRDPWWPKAA
jgi:DNA-binding transcriptional LysR family regulator